MHRVFRPARAACLLALGSTLSVLAAETVSSPAPGAKAPSEATNDAQQAWRSYLQLQDQLRSAMLALEQARKESEANARRDADAFTDRLRAIEQAVTNQRAFEQALASQRERDLVAMQSANRLLLMVAGIFAAVSVLTMFFTVWFQMRALNRLAEIASHHRDTFVLDHTPVAALGAGNAAQAALSPVEVSSKRLLGLVEQLEKRLQEMEHTAQPAGAGHSSGGKTNGEPKQPADESSGDSAGGEVSEQQSHLDTLLGKGQTLLNLGQVDKAISCFDEAIALAPNHAEALMKKGHALERLQKLQEALECYDLAIAANDSLTLAYVYKGGVYNQLERYDEALACYEKALRAQQQSGQSVSAVATPA